VFNNAPLTGYSTKRWDDFSKERQSKSNVISNQGDFKMTEKEYFNRSEVIEFVEWLIPKLKNYPVEIEYKDEPEPFHFIHFKSIEDAADKYRWRFSYIESATNKKITGTTYEHSKREFTKFRKSLKKGIVTNCNKLCSDTCKDILAWGRVLNKGRNKEKANNITAQYLKEIIDFFPIKISLLII
jgi:hypothetical protein